jgi:hypothetical protein
LGTYLLRRKRQLEKCSTDRLLELIAMYLFVLTKLCGLQFDLLMSLILRQQIQPQQQFYLLLLATQQMNRAFVRLLYP